jgi:flagellar basal-body rod protein FlgB
MLIQDLESAGSLPVLGKMLQFAAQRQKLLANNIANMETPDYRPVDVSVKDFQKSLAKAVQQRRGETGGEQGELPVEDSKEVVNARDGGLELKPKTASGNILYHDRNNRDIERMMQDLAENGLTYKATVDLIRRQNDILRAAISQRV